MEREGKKLRAGAPSERVSPAQAPRRDRTFLPGHAAHCPSLPDSPRGRSALRLLRTSRRRLIGLTLVFASSNCSTGEPDRTIQGFALMLPSPRRYAVGPNEAARRPPDHSVDVVQLRRSASCRRPGSPLMMPSRRRAKRDRPQVVRPIDCEFHVYTAATVPPSRGRTVAVMLKAVPSPAPRSGPGAF